MPNFGYSGNRGAYLGLAYYQVMGPSVDLTLQLDGYERTYAGAGADLRYAPREGTKGDLAAYMLYDRDLKQQEWRALWSHTAENLPGGFRGVISVNQYSDYNFFRQFQRLEGENTRSFLYSNAFLSGDWGVQSLSMMVDQRETFLNSAGDTSTQRQLPEINYQVRKLKLGAIPLYLSVNSTASYLQSTTPDVFDINYGRFDVAPQLTLPLNVAPWLSVALNGGGRATWWGESRSVSVKDPDTGVVTRVCDSGAVGAGDLYCGENLTRDLSDRRPRHGRPLVLQDLRLARRDLLKFKHIIEPRFSYGYVGTSTSRRRCRSSTRSTTSGPPSVGTVTLINRVLAKPTDEQQGGAFEMASLRARAVVFLRRHPATPDLGGRHALEPRGSARGAPAGQSVEQFRPAGQGRLFDALLEPRLDLALDARPRRPRLDDGDLVHQLQRFLRRQHLRPGRGSASASSPSRTA